VRKNYYIYGFVVITITVGKFITFTVPCYYIYGQNILLHLRSEHFITFTVEIDYIYGYLQFYCIYGSYIRHRTLVLLTMDQESVSSVTKLWFF